jgi:hypothetical protein
LNHPDLTKEQKEFLQGRIDALNKKSTSKKTTENQKRNVELANAVYDYMEVDKMYTITDLMKEVPAFQEVDPLSNQFATNIVKILKDDGRVTRLVDKGRAKFVKVVVEVEGE